MKTVILFTSLFCTMFFTSAPVGDIFPDLKGESPDAYDINLYFVPMFTGTKAAAAASAKAKMKQQVQEDIQPHVLIYRGELDAYKDKLKMDDKSKPYIFVLDKTGKIIYTTSGPYTEDKMDEIDDQIE